LIKFCLFFIKTFKNETDLKNEVNINDAANEPVVNLLMKSKKDVIYLLLWF